MPDDPRLFYEHHIFMCNNVRPEGHPRGCCSARGGGRGFEKLRGYAREKARQLGIENVRFNAAGCLDRCEFGPNMVIYPEGVWYRFESQADIDEILETHLKNGGRVERLMLQPDQNVTPAGGCRSIQTRSSPRRPAPGRAAIAIVRVSEPDRGRRDGAASGLCAPPPPCAACAAAGPGQRRALDDGLALWFPAPRSVTGEDVAELHLHGGRAVVSRRSMAALRGLGLRLAEPGEFTRRAFLNGKLDLTQAEAIADLAAAETEAQRRQALRQLDGALGDALSRLERAAAAAAGASRSGDRFPRRGPAAGDRGAGRGRDRRRSARRSRAHLADGASRRAAARRHRGGDRRSAECRQVQPAESAGAARGGDHLADRRHDARRDRGRDRPRRVSGRAGGYRRAARGGGWIERRACAAPCARAEAADLRSTCSTRPRRRMPTAPADGRAPIRSSSPTRPISRNARRARLAADRRVGA